MISSIRFVFVGVTAQAVAMGVAAAFFSKGYGAFQATGGPTLPFSLATGRDHWQCRDFCKSQVIHRKSSTSSAAAPRRRGRGFARARMRAVAVGHMSFLCVINVYVGEGRIPCSTGAGGVGSIPANSDAQNVPSFRRWRFEMKLSPFCMFQSSARACKGTHTRTDTRTSIETSEFAPDPACEIVSCI
jgi:hypothetical protein